MNAKYKYPLLLGGLILLGLVQYKGFIPLAYKAAESDLFLIDNDDAGSREATKNAYTEMAFKQCNDYIKEELGDKLSVSFSPAPINSWGLGNYEYLINADININSTPPRTERYACRIQFDPGKDTSDLGNKNNWSMIGISGIEEL
ncbi:MAG: hypothetical protein HOP02_00685 [Methylococcaceae bacterium]|nr:hypothetical protein [Methylococcaceae bacterium]